MVRSRQEAALKAQQELAAQLEPGLTILARVNPAWPAMVMKEDDLPASVRKVKPSKKVVVPVLFYNDGSFQWISPSEAEYLDKPAAVKASKSKIKKQLKEAYAIAADPPSYEELLESLNAPAEEAAEPEEAAAQSEDAEDDAEMEVESKSSRPRRARSAAEQASGIPRAKRAKLSSEKQASKQTKPSPKQEDEDSEYVDSGSAPESTETSSGAETGAETTDGEFDEKSLAKKQTLRYDLCLETRKTLQELLVNPLIKEEDSQVKEEIKTEEIKTEESKNGEANTEETKVEEIEPPKVEITDSDLKKCEDLLNTVLSAPIEISVLRRSKLSRVVTFILQTSVPESLREKLDKVASQYNTQSEPIIRGIPEHLAPTEEEEQTRENTEEPQSHFPSEAPSEGPSEAPSEAPSEVPSESQVNAHSTEEAKPNGETATESSEPAN